MAVVVGAFATSRSDVEHMREQGRATQAQVEHVAEKLEDFKKDKGSTDLRLQRVEDNNARMLESMGELKTQQREIMRLLERRQR